MSAQPLAAIELIADDPGVGRRSTQEISWPQIIVAAPQMAATMARYLDQLAVSARPGTVDVGRPRRLRQFAGSVTESDPSCRTMAQVDRAPHRGLQALARPPARQARARCRATTISCRLGLLRTFFERIIEWGYDDAPARVPIFAGDFPDRDEPLPKFLDDPTAAKFMASLATDPNPRRRLMVELLARTGMRSGELVRPRRRRHGPHRRHPLAPHPRRQAPQRPLRPPAPDPRRAHRPPTTPPRPTSRSGRLVERDDGRPFDRRTIHRYVTAVAKRAGVGHVHPHQLRHTLATQAINRGMSLEAIAALLGHRSMKHDPDLRPHLRPHRRRRVLPRHRRRRGQLPGDPLTADTAGPIMTGVAADHRRLLGNGHCTRPAALDCIHESICEGCGFFETGPEFVPVLIRQRDHATDRDQTERARLFTNLLDNLDTTG